MPRKTLQDSIGVGVSDYGPAVRLVDEDGDSLVEKSADAVRTMPVDEAGNQLSDTLIVLEEISSTLKKTHLGHELHLWEEEVTEEE